MTIDNKTCPAVSRDDVIGLRPREVRLQIYISMTLGVGAFLLFCVRQSRIAGQQHRADHIIVPAPTVEGLVRCTQKAKQLRNRAS